MIRLGAFRLKFEHRYPATGGDPRQDAGWLAPGIDDELLAEVHPQLAT
jgi:hypothetical protein